jgi:anti-anti-sigma factor
MDILTEAGADTLRLRLQGDCNIYSVGELRNTLLERLREQAALELDLSAVTEFDTAWLQVLMAAKNFARLGAQSLRLSGHSPAVLSLIALYDLADWLGDPLVGTDGEAAGLS